MEAIDILRTARARIVAPDQWGKGRRNRERPMDTCCAAEAIEEVAAPGKERSRAIGTFYCAAGLDRDFGALVDWNDAPERTHAEVVATFNLAIAILRLR
jgi:hypothetical protein